MFASSGATVADTPVSGNSIAASTSVDGTVVSKAASATLHFAILAGGILSD